MRLSPLSLILLVLSPSFAGAQVFENEPNNTLVQANALFSGVPISAQLISASDVDTYSITVSGGGGLNLSFTRASFGIGDYTISVFDATGDLRAAYDTTPSLTLSQVVGAPSAGIYYIQIKVKQFFSNGQYSFSVTSLPLTPTIVAQPTNQTAVVGSSATFSVRATGIPPLSYLWRWNGVVVPNASTDSVTFPSIRSTDAGVMTVTISNASGSITSSAASLTVSEPNQPRLVNLSVFTPVPTNDSVIAGFVVHGSAPRTVLVRAVGPSLSLFSVAGTLVDPRVTLSNAATRLPILSNDDWLASDGVTMQRVGAFALPAFSKDAALVATLQPGNYTAQVSGAGGASGIVLIEVYEVP